MTEIPYALTATGTATLTFELTDADGGRVARIPEGRVRMTVRRVETPRDAPELALLNASMDAGSAIVTLELSGGDTRRLVPDLDAREERVYQCVTDIRIHSDDAIDFYGPYEFGLRLPVTYEDPGDGPEALDINIFDIEETTAMATVGVARPDGSRLYLRWKTTEEAEWVAAINQVVTGDTATFTITPIVAGKTYQVRASFDQDFQEGVAAARFDSQFLTPTDRFTYITTPYTTSGVALPIPDAATILASGRRTTDIHPAPILWNDPGESGYGWIFTPEEINYVSLGSPAAFNQFVTFPFHGMVTIENHDYFAYLNNVGLSQRAYTDFQWYAYYRE